MRILLLMGSVAADPVFLQTRAHEFTGVGLLDPGTEVELRSPRVSGGGADSPYDSFVMELGVLEAGLGAEAEGFDAVCISSMSDSALAQLRSRLTIPVVGPGLVAYHVAGIVGGKFSIVATTPAWRHFYLKNLKLYGLEHRLASIRDLGLDWTLEGFYGSGGPEKVAAVVAAARRAIDEDGADAIVLGSTTMAPAVGPLQAACEVPVIDPGPWALRIAESMVKLGVSHSKRAFPASAFDHDAALRRMVDAAPGP